MMLNLHLDWVALQVDDDNVWWCYACPSTLYFPQVSWHGDFIVILSKSSTWQGDPLGGTLFTFVHFHTLCLIIITDFTCVFTSLKDDTHIIVGFTLDVVPIFLWLQHKFLTIELLM
jgi:hypothetical protein